MEAIGASMIYEDRQRGFRRAGHAREPAHESDQSSMGYEQVGY